MLTPEAKQVAAQFKGLRGDVLTDPRTWNLCVNQYIEVYVSTEDLPEFRQLSGYDRLYYDGDGRPMFINARHNVAAGE